MRSVILVLLVACSPQSRRPAMIAGGAAFALGVSYSVGAMMSAPIGSCDANTEDCEGDSPVPGLVIALTGLVVAIVAAASPDDPAPISVGPTRIRPAGVIPPEDLPRERSGRFLHP